MIELNTLKRGDCSAFMKEIESAFVNIIYTDVPYNMNSRYYIDKQGHYRFKGKGSDFMGKWEAMDGLWWYEHFKEAYRILKQGGFYITHNIDRQSDLWAYYARRAGFFPMQKLYWLFIDNYPKGVDLGTALDKLEGVKREVVGIKKGAQAESTGKYGSWGKSSIFNRNIKNNEERETLLNNAKDQHMLGQDYLKGKMSIYEATIATSEIAKKYDGYKYGQAALKQIAEEILVFWKEPIQEKLTVPKMISLNESDKKYGRPQRYHPAIFNIKETRVPPSSMKKGSTEIDRWTPQLAISTDVLPYLIDQMNHEDAHRLTDPLHKIKFFADDIIPYHFCKKTSKAERNAGLNENNPHPTPKPIELCEWVLKLFKPPDHEDMVIYDPFSGQCSIPIAAENLGFKWIGTEGDNIFYDIGLMKIEHYREERKQELKLNFKEK